MSDALIIAFLGVTGTLLAGLVSNWINIRGLRVQITAQSHALQEELRQRNEEARRARLSEARSSYLVPFRQKLLGALGSIQSYQSASEQWVTTNYGSITEGQAKELDDNLRHWQQVLAEATAEIMTYSIQFSDPLLLKLFDELWRNEVEASRSLASFLIPSSWFSVLSEHARFKELLEGTRDKRNILLIKMNKRIEELLAGDETVE